MTSINNIDCNDSPGYLIYGEKLDLSARWTKTGIEKRSIPPYVGISHFDFCSKCAMHGFSMNEAETLPLIFPYQHVR